MRGRFLLVSFLALSAGCSTLNSRAIDERLDARLVQGRLDYAAKHQAELTPEVAQAIREGRVLVGMSEGDAMMAWADWGPPLTANRTTTEGGSTVQYVFEKRVAGTVAHRQRYLYVRDGRVVAIQD